MSQNQIIRIKQGFKWKGKRTLSLLGCSWIFTVCLYIDIRIRPFVIPIGTSQSPGTSRARENGHLIVKAETWIRKLSLREIKWTWRKTRNNLTSFSLCSRSDFRSVSAEGITSSENILDLQCAPYLYGEVSTSQHLLLQWIFHQNSCRSWTLYLKKEDSISIPNQDTLSRFSTNQQEINMVLKPLVLIQYLTS